MKNFVSHPPKRHWHILSFPRSSFRRSCLSRPFSLSHLDSERDERTRFVAVLEIPAVVSAETAVRLQIVADSKKYKKRDKNGLFFLLTFICLGVVLVAIFARG
jgi:hypothetical protein